MNGGAWLSLHGTKVDVLLRDLDVVLYWSGQARLGVYELDALLGYLAGAPTYSLMAELALNRTVNGPLNCSSSEKFRDKMVPNVTPPVFPMWKKISKSGVFNIRCFLTSTV